MTLDIMAALLSGMGWALRGWTRSVSTTAEREFRPELMVLQGKREYSNTQ